MSGGSSDVDPYIGESAEEPVSAAGVKVRRRNAYRKLSDAPQPFAPTSFSQEILPHLSTDLNEIEEEVLIKEMISEEEQLSYLREWEKGIVALKFGRKGPKQRKFQIDCTSGSLVCSHGFGNFKQPDLGIMDSKRTQTLLLFLCVFS